MKSFKQYLYEMPWVNDDIPKGKIAPYDANAGNLPPSMHLQPISKMGDHTVAQRRWGSTKGSYHLVNPEGKTVMRVTGEHGEGNKFNVSELQGSAASPVKAHEFYHHLITQHDVHLHSDYEQSPGGMKTWKNLHKMPGIHMQSYNGSSEKYSELKPSFQRKYDMDSSTRLAAKKIDK